MVVHYAQGKLGVVQTGGTKKTARLNDTGKPELLLFSEAAERTEAWDPWMEPSSGREVPRHTVSADTDMDRWTPLQRLRL